MPITNTQARTIQAIVNLFETSQVLGNYGQVTLLTGDTGHLTFGRSQTTLGSGGLHDLVERYCGNPGARFGRRLAPWLPQMKDRDVRLDADAKLHNILMATADDPVMRDTQDAFFEERFFVPAMRTAERLGIREPLGCAVVYDSQVHGGFSRVSARVEGTPATLGERAWVGKYVAARRDWLTGSTRADLRATSYRMDAFNRLIELNMWALELPLVVRGAEISPAILTALPNTSYDGPQPGVRPLVFETSAPLCRGLDVRLVQVALAERGANVHADGVYGRASAAHVADFQRAQGMPVTGVADAALVAQLAAEALGAVV
jgi:chitosanase